MFRKLRQLLGFGPDETLRDRVEHAIARDDADALAAVLRPHQDSGKILIREYAQELGGITDEDERKRIQRCITAMVAVYAQVFQDEEPLNWFQAAADRANAPESAKALEKAQQTFQAGDPEEAARIAAAGFEALPDDPARRNPLAAVESSLLAVQGGCAAHAGRLEEALGFFERALEPAERSDADDAVAASYLNLLDVRTRLGRFEEDDVEWKRAAERARGTRYEDVAAKLVTERGMAHTGRGTLDAAMSALDEAVALRPQWPFPLYQRAWTRFLRGDSGGALDDYRDVAARVPVFYTVQREIRCLEDVAAGTLPLDAYRSFCLVRDRIPKDAKGVRETAQRIVDRHPDFAPGWLLLAESSLALGDRETGRTAARRALDADPDSDTGSAALFVEWNVANRLEDPDAANAAADRLAAEYPDHPATAILGRLRDNPDPNRVVRWAWSLDGKLTVDEVSREDRTPPPPAPPG